MRDLQIGEQTHKFRFTVRDILLFESEVGEMNKLQEIIGESISKSIDVAADILRIGLNSANRSLGKAEISKEQALDIMDEGGLESMEAIFNAFGEEAALSGGNAKKTGGNAKVTKITG